MRMHVDVRIFALEYVCHASVIMHTAQTQWAFECEVWKCHRKYVDSTQNIIQKFAGKGMAKVLFHVFRYLFP